MKSDITTTILNCVLLVLAVLGIVFAIFYYMRGHELATIATQANSDRNFLMAMQGLVNQVADYNQKHPSPELTKILQTMVAKPDNK